MQQHGPILASPDDRLLHARLLKRDPTAPADLALTHLDSLVRRLRRRFPRVDEHLVQDVAISLILSLAERPEQYNPERSTLASYLRMAASGDLKNALRSEQRRARRQVALEAVELAQRAGNLLIESPFDPAEVVARAESADSGKLARLRSHFDSTEWEVIHLMSERERRTAIYAVVLGIGHKPLLEQAREVKRVKDRLLKRLRRLIRKEFPDA